MKFRSPPEDYVPIADADLPSQVGKGVHVTNWNRGAVFIYKGTDPNGVHTLVTSKTRRRFTTRYPLYYTRRNAPTSP